MPEPFTVWNNHEQAMHADNETTISQLKERIRSFADARDWEQFHSPKNLGMALASEAGELMEHFLWVDLEESRRICDDTAKRGLIADELADVLIYALRFADVVESALLSATLWLASPCISLNMNETSYVRIL